MSRHLFGRVAADAMRASTGAVAVPAKEVITAEPPAAEETTPERRSKPKKQPPYAVILHNDNFNGFDYVVSVLRKVFNYGRPKAFQLTMAAHTSGRSIVWSGVLELAELKADQIRSCGPDPVAKANGALTLRVTVEALPG
jgi:ATP-dependent Clp protease adaptor protein ClpS